MRIELTAEDEAIITRASHVPFMVWLVEARDAVDAGIMRRETLATRDHSATQYQRAFNRKYRAFRGLSSDDLK